ncbi:hypothetical protein PIB30_053318 [Stylosanthes scabra]|uniref:Uncharacterized protein n=1 Tax=Stylosanthes scabra TaxID=79078 RepID=A0ABU6ZH79_9FABA|nr:hypothetical protein [Stylosanthes scabra]
MKGKTSRRQPLLPFSPLSPPFSNHSCHAAAVDRSPCLRLMPPLKPLSPTSVVAVSASTAPSTSPAAHHQQVLPLYLRCTALSTAGAQLSLPSTSAAEPLSLPSTAAAHHVFFRATGSTPEVGDQNVESIVHSSTKGQDDGT